MLITGQTVDLDISQPGDCANISISVDMQHLTTCILAVVHSDISEDKSAAG